MRRQLRMAGQDISHLPTKPKDYISCKQFLDDFYNLSTTRPMGFGVGVISWLSVQEYAIIRGYDEFVTHFLHNVVRELDPLFVSHHNDKSTQGKVGN